MSDEIPNVVKEYTTPFTNPFKQNTQLQQSQPSSQTQKFAHNKPVNAPLFTLDYGSSIGGNCNLPAYKTHGLGQGFVQRKGFNDGNYKSQRGRGRGNFRLSHVPYLKGLNLL